MKDFGSKKYYCKNDSYENLDNFLAFIDSAWVDQLLPQILMDQFDTLPTQCRPIEHMHAVG